MGHKWDKMQTHQLMVVCIVNITLIAVAVLVDMVREWCLASSHIRHI